MFKTRRVFKFCNLNIEIWFQIVNFEFQIF